MCSCAIMKNKMLSKSLNVQKCRVMHKQIEVLWVNRRTCSTLVVL